MILSRHHFELEGKCVIEKLVIRTPFRYPAVFKNEACFIYVNDGNTTLASPNEKITIRVSESILLRCGHYFADLMQEAPSGTCEIFVVHLYPEILKTIYANEIPDFIKPSGKTNYSNKLENQTIVSHFINSLIFYFENPHLVNRELLQLKLKELMLLLLQTKSADTIIDLVSQLFTPRHATLTEVINTHLFTNLYIEELATLADMSVSVFKREFHKQFGDTPANHIKKTRLKRAAELLQISTETISEITYQTGFNDIAHFSRSFKEHFGLTPTDYRLHFSKPLEK